MNDLMLKLLGMRCVGANGQVFEEPSQVGIKNEREIDPSEKSFDNHLMNLFKAIKLTQKKGLVLPSLPLTLNMLLGLSESKDVDYKKLLSEYSSISEQDQTSYWTNTVVVINEKREMRIIHYPSTSDLLEWDRETHKRLNLKGEYTQALPHIILEQITEGLSKGLNKRVLASHIPFEMNPKYKHHLNYVDLEQALKVSEFDSFFRNLTGLEDPNNFLKLARHLWKKPVFSPYNLLETKGILFTNISCTDHEFSVNLYSSPYLVLNVRGVDIK